MKDNTIPLTLIGILADGEFHSGEQLGEQLGMSRAAINKHIQTLRDWGVDVFTVPGKGYSLPEPIQLLNEEVIRSQIGHGNVAVLPVIDSTNQYLLDRLSELKSGDACVAEYQQAGRGRRGRKWFSPFGANLYLSMYWRLEQGPAAAIGLSLVIGIVMAEVLHDLGADQVRVKWPNDLYLNDRKLAGILVELTGKTGDAAQIVIGAGLNMVMRNVQNDVVNQAWTNLQEAGITIDRNTLAVRMINELRSSLTLFEQEGLAPFLSRWEKLDNFINRPVKLLIGDKEIYGTSRGIDAQGALLLEQDGVIKPWVGGEISLRSAGNPLPTGRGCNRSSLRIRHPIPGIQSDIRLILILDHHRIGVFRYLRRLRQPAGELIPIHAIFHKQLTVYSASNQFRDSQIAAWLGDFNGRSLMRRLHAKELNPGRNVSDGRA